jgi:hypothetical protein
VSILYVLTDYFLSLLTSLSSYMNYSFQFLTIMLQLISNTLKSATRWHNPTSAVTTALISRSESLRFNCPYKDEESVEDLFQGRLHPVNIGDVFGGYRVVRKLGSGRFSTSWLARNESWVLFQCF